MHKLTRIICFMLVAGCEAPSGDELLADEAEITDKGNAGQASANADISLQVEVVEPFTRIASQQKGSSEPHAQTVVRLQGSISKCAPRALIQDEAESLANKVARDGCLWWRQVRLSDLRLTGRNLAELDKDELPCGFDTNADAFDPAETNVCHDTIVFYRNPQDLRIETSAGYDAISGRTRQHLKVEYKFGTTRERRVRTGCVEPSQTKGYRGMVADGVNSVTAAQEKLCVNQKPTQSEDTPPSRTPE